MSDPEAFARRVVLPVAAAISVGAFPAPGGLAQTRTTVVPAELRCASCTARVATLVTIGRPTDSVLVMRGSVIVANSRGEYLVAPVSTPGAIAVYDSTGRLRRTIGRKGQGPGEFGDIYSIWPGTGDSLYVYDRGRRAMVVLGPDHRHVRVVPLPVSGLDLVLLPEGGFIVPGQFRTPARISLPLHLYGPAGQFLRSFGRERVEPPAGERSPPPIAAFAHVGADTFWVTVKGRYDIEAWASRDSVPLRVLRRDAPFYPEHIPTYSRFGADGRPLPSVNSMRLDPAGRLWVSLSVPDPRGTLPRGRGDERAGLLAVRDWPSVLDGRVEVIDPARGELITAAELPVPVRFLGAPGRGTIRVYSLVEDERGYFRLDVSQVSINLP